jgi:chromate transporter
VGLLLAGTLSMARGAVTGWTTGGIALAILLIMLWRKVNPALLVLGGAVVGGIVFMPK